MRIILNDKEVVIPSSLSEFTLGQRIDFYNQHGRLLDEMAKSILEMEDGLMKDLEVAEFSFEKMFRTFAFFAGTTPEALKESEFVDDIASIYHASLATLMEDEQQVELKTEYYWNKELWVLHPPELKHGSKMQFGEFVDAKQLIKDLTEVAAGRWEVMLRLCAIYLRKPGESFLEEFLYDGSDRLQLMRSVPMHIALAVGFFLSSSLNICLNTLRFSSPPASKTVEGDSALSTSIAGDGSTFLNQLLRPRSSTSQGEATPSSVPG